MEQPHRVKLSLTNNQVLVELLGILRSRIDGIVVGNTSNWIVIARPNKVLTLFLLRHADQIEILN